MNSPEVHLPAFLDVLSDLYAPDLASIITRAEAPGDNDDAELPPDEGGGGEGSSPDAAEADGDEADAWWSWNDGDEGDGSWCDAVLAEGADISMTGSFVDIDSFDFGAAGFADRSQDAATDDDAAPPAETDLPDAAPDWIVDALTGIPDAFARIFLHEGREVPGLEVLKPDGSIFREWRDEAHDATTITISHVDRFGDAATETFHHDAEGAILWIVLRDAFGVETVIDLAGVFNDLHAPPPSDGAPEASSPDAQWPDGWSKEDADAEPYLPFPEVQILPACDMPAPPPQDWLFG
jgi:hypothetical protein